MSSHATAITIALFALLAVGCEGTTTVNNAPELTSDGVVTDTADEVAAEKEGPEVDQPDDAELTYHRDVRPILEASCTECHTQGGIGPFALTSYDQVAPLASLVANAMTTGQMPPWPPAEDCQELSHARTVGAEDIEMVSRWAELGAPAGNPEDYEPRPSTGAQIELASPDVAMDIGVDYRPTPPDGGPDDHRCFVMDPELDETRYVNALRTQPSNLKIAHHMLLFSVSADQADALAALEAEDGDAGFDCFSGAGVPGASLLGGWVPGSPPMQYPEGAGIELEAGSLVVAQMHYNTLNDSEGTDRTRVDLHFVDGEPTTALALMPFANFGFHVPVGEQETVSQSMRLPADVTLYGIAPHMHLFGQSVRVNVASGDDSTCLVDVPEWDFNWQGFYAYKEPIELKQGSEITLECDFDNRMESQPPGVTSPGALTWGDGTYDEMCITYFVVARQ